MTLSQACVRTAVRGLNLGGRTLRRLGVDTPALDADSLHRAAHRRAGSSRYGTWDFAEPLERLLKSYHDEANLTTLGRITVREYLVSLLDNLLRMETERAANPSIEQQRIAAPVFIVGLPRTGTTHLHGLISEDPANRTPLTWEVMYPAASRSAAEVARARAQTAARLALGRSPRAGVHAHSSDRGRLTARVHRDHGASLHEHPVPHDARRRVVSGLVRTRAAETRLRLSPSIAAALASEERGRSLGAQSAGAFVRARWLARALPRRSNHPHASRPAARDGFDGESCDGAAPRVQRQRRSETNRCGLGRPLGTRARNISRRSRFARHRRNSST